MRALRLAALFAFLAAVFPVAADQHKNQLKGFNPENVYYAHDIDAINAFNGNLTLTIPIGPEFPVAEGFSYRLTAHSNGNLWDIQEVNQPQYPTGELSRGVGTHVSGLCDTILSGVTVAHPDRRANAGMGWLLTLGRLFPPYEPTRTGQGGWMYESPDGAEHLFSERLHSEDLTEGETDDVEYTTDGTYLRMKVVGGNRVVEFPDGSVHTFAPSPTGRGPWMPVQLKRHGSNGFVNIAYPLHAGDPTMFDWVITDSHGRTHTLLFERKLWDGGWKAIVTSVDLEAFDTPASGTEPRAVYQFNYSESSIGRSPHHEPCPGFDRGAKVQFLDSIVLPDSSASRYSFAYNRATSGLNSPAGELVKATLPTGGVIEWDWSFWIKPAGHHMDHPHFANSWGVVGRHKLPGATGAMDSWLYGQYFDGNYYQDDLVPLPHEMMSVLESPTGELTASYFSVSTDDHEGWLEREYGKPFSRSRNDGAGKWITQAVFAPHATPRPPDPSRPDRSPTPRKPDITKALRTTYVRYEHDTDLVANSRVAATRVVHDRTNPEDTPAGMWIDTLHEDFDGLGHYRKTTVQGSQFPFGNLKKWSVTNYNPGAGSYPEGFSMILPTTPWIIGTYSSIETSQQADPPSGAVETSRADYCFDATNGRLNMVRTRRGAGLDDNDLLVVYKHTDGDGNVDAEEYFGGDGTQHLAPSELCVNGSNPRYRLNHTYGSGVRLTTQYDGVSFKSAHLVADPSTGLPSESRDGAGAITKYEYTALGQLSAVRPPGQAWTQYQYSVNPEGAPHGTVIVRQWPHGSTATGTPLTEERYYYDRFGRLEQQRRRMPGLGPVQQWSASAIQYDAMGRKARTTVAVKAESGEYGTLPGSPLATVLTYDNLGRVKTTTLPDGSSSTTLYNGPRTTTRSSTIATPENEQTVVWNAEHYDAHGRLVTVVENSTAPVTADRLFTQYQYDEGNRLTRVESGVQTRTFTYDDAGLLNWEKHPEMAETYYRYDSRGHVTKKIVSKTNPGASDNITGAAVALSFTYDPAERLQGVKDEKSDKLLKDFAYDITRNGMPWTQTRFNYFEGDGHYSVTDTFTYESTTGRPQSKKTDVTRVPATGAHTTHTFTHNYDYNALGAPDKVKYPTCPTCGGSASTERNLQLTYDQGLLTGIEKVTTASGDLPGISYTPSGAVHQVQHAKADGQPGVLDTFQPDPSGMARVHSITFENALEPVCEAPTAEAHDTSTGYNAVATLTVTAGGTAPRTYKWYRGALGDRTVIVPGDAYSVPSPPLTASADFWVEITNGCGTATDTLHVEVGTCTTPDVTAQNVTIPYDTSAPLEVTATGSATLHYAWYRGPLDDTTNPVGTDNRTFPTPNLTASENYWVRVWNACGEDKVAIHVTVTSCETPFTLTAVPAAFAEGKPFQLRATATSGTSYRWYRLNGAERTLLGTTSTPAFDIAAIDVQTRYVAEMDGGACTSTSSEFVIEPCLMKRAITTTPLNDMYRLWVVDDQPGVTFQWYEGFDHSDLSRPLDADADILVDPEVPTHYWVRMTRICGAVSVALDSDFEFLRPECPPTILVHPVPDSASRAAGQVASATVVAGGPGPFRYQWYEVAANGNATAIPGATGETFEWNYAPGEFQEGQAGRSRVVYAEVKHGTRDPQLFAPSDTPANSNRVTLAIATTPQHIDSSSGSVTLTTPQQRALLFVTMAPAQETNVHEYEYDWYMDDGTPDGFRYGHTNPALSVAAFTAVYWVKITGIHYRGTPFEYREVTLSERMLVRLSSSCDLAPVRVQQSLQKICLGGPTYQSPLVTFRVITETPDVHFQWYSGQTGDTRVPLDSDPGKPRELTIGGNMVQKVWVRATTECGASMDSPTHYFERGNCLPLFINQTVPGTEVEWGSDAQLVFAPLTQPGIAYRWHEHGVFGAPDADLAVTTPTLTLEDVTKSGYYVLNVWNTNCPGSGSSTLPTLVRVASAPGMIPPNWVTEVWRDADATTGTVLSGATTGGVRWQWFRGEMLDESNPVADSAADSFTTPLLTVDTRYWVRVHGPTGKFLDSPTITVKNCNVPKLTPAQEAALLLNRDIFANQQVTFYVPFADPVSGTAFTYQWYRGASLDTSVPLANQTTQYLQVSPAVTTQYWFRATSICGVGGNNPRHYNSPTFTASVCAVPVIDAQPSATPVRSFTGSPVTLSVAASVTTGTLTYQWYEGAPGETGTPLAGGTTATITVSPSGQTSYWVRVKSGVCTTDSAGVTVLMCTYPQTVTLPANVNIPHGGTATLTFPSLFPGDVKTIRWYRGVSGDTTNLVAGGNLPFLNLTTPELTATTQYWMEFDHNGCTTRSNTVTVTVCQPTILTQPVGGTIAGGGSRTLSITTTPLPGQTIQWYRGAVGDTSLPLAGATTLSVAVTPTTTTSYWVRVTGTCTPAAVADSEGTTVVVCTPPSMTTTSFPTSIQSGQQTAVGVTATGANLTYQWYTGTSGTTTSPIAGATSTMHYVSPTTTTSYWCRVTSEGTCTADSATMTVTVCSPPTITQQPAAAPARIFAGQTTALSVAATANGGTMTYQWYTGASGETSAPVSGATAATLNVTPSVQTSYWVRVTTAVCSVDSAAVTVFMCTYPQTVTLPATVNIAHGESTTIAFPSVFPTDVKTIRWYRGNSGDHTNLVLGGNASSLNFTTPALTATTKYWVEFEHNGCITTSNHITVTVCKPTITTQPVGGTIASGSSYTLSIATTPIPGQTIQWYRGAVGVTTLPLVGATNPTVAVNPATTTSYWARVKGSCTPDAVVDSEGVTLIVCTPPTVSTTNFPTSIQSGQQASVGVTASGSNLTYQWFRGTSGTTTNPIAGATSAIYSTSPTTTTSYWCRVTSEGLCTTNSATMTVNVCTPPTITQQPAASPARIFAGGTATLSVSATAGGAIAYQWYTGAAGNTSSPVNGATASALTVTPSVQTSYWVRVTTSVCTTDSTAVTVFMCTYPQTVTLPSNVNIAHGASTILAFPSVFPTDVKTIRWYRGASGDRTNLVLAGNASSLNFTTPALTATAQYWVEFEHNGCITTSNATTVTVCKPTITTQPVGGTIAAGSSRTLSITTTPIAGQTIQWYRGAVGVTTLPLAGATGLSVAVTPATTTSYWVRVRGTCSPEELTDSEGITVVVCNPPTMTTTNFPTSIQSGQQTAVGVTASGSNLTYQWYTGTSGTTTNPIAGATSSMHYVSPTTTTSYWCRVTADDFCTANSATMTVNVCNPPSITQQPSASPQRIFSGSSSTLSVTATGGGTLSYQWYTGAAGNTSSPVAGATSATLSVAPTVDTSYWVRVTTSVCSTNSAAVTVSLCTYPSSVTLPATRDIASGETPTLAFPTVSPTNVSKYIRWYRGASGDRTNLVHYNASATSLNYTTPALTVNTSYWVEFEHNGCVTSSSATLVRVCKPTITASPQSATILTGASRTLTVTATGSPLTYQWYTGNTGVTTQPIAGATSASLTVTPAGTTTYWVRATGCGTTADSAQATITVCQAPAVGTITRNGSSQPGGQGSMNITATGTDLTYQWYKGSTGDVSQPIAGATSTNYLWTNTVSQSYWVRVTSTCSGTTADSAAFIYYVSPTITAHPANATIPRNTSTTVSVTASGTYLTYQWYQGTNTVISGATSPTLTTPVLSTGVTNFWCQVSSGTASANSLGASISLCDGPTITSFTQTYNYGTTYRLTVAVHSSAIGLVDYHWYSGVPGNVAQSTYLGQSQYGHQQYFNVTTPTTYWVRVAYEDGSCYRDTAGYTLP